MPAHRGEHDDVPRELVLEPDRARNTSFVCVFLIFAVPGLILVFAGSSLLPGGGDFSIVSRTVLLAYVIVLLVMSVQQVAGLLRRGPAMVATSASLAVRRFGRFHQHAWSDVIEIGHVDTERLREA